MKNKKQLMSNSSTDICIYKGQLDSPPIITLRADTPDLKKKRKEERIKENALKYFKGILRICLHLSRALSASRTLYLLEVRQVRANGL